MSLRTIRLAVLCAVLAGVVVGPAMGDECEMTTSEAYLDAPGHYVVFDRFVVVAPCSAPAVPLLGIWWVYEEANGRDGLQRRDENRDDTCNGLYPSDKIVL